MIDEAQRIENAGITLKLIIDNIPNIQLVVTGSSAFDLHNRLNEPLTGRKFEYRLYPFSTAELIKATSFLEKRRLLEQRLIYGMYQDVVNNPSDLSRNLRNEIKKSRKIYFYDTGIRNALIQNYKPLEFRLYAFEFKWNEERKSKIPVTFKVAYPQHEIQIINRTNYLKFLSLKKCQHLKKKSPLPTISMAL